MSNITTARLIEAAKWISKYEDSQLSMIQFEDGSGKNFNYTVAKTGRTKFITWDDLCIGLGFNPDNLCTTAKKPTIDEATTLDLFEEIKNRVLNQEEKTFGDLLFKDFCLDAYRVMLLIQQQTVPKKEYNPKVIWDHTNGKFVKIPKDVND